MYTSERVFATYIRQNLKPNIVVDLDEKGVLMRRVVGSLSYQKVAGS